MDKFYEFLKKYSAPAFLGLAPNLIFGYNITTWQWWALVITTIVLYEWKGN